MIGDSVVPIPRAAVATMHTDGPWRVLLLVNRLGGGGTERNVATFCKHADKSRFLPEVWSLLGDGDLEPMVREAGVEFRCLHRKCAYDPLFAMRAAREIARADADLIHVFLPTVAFNAALAKAFWNAKAPLIYSEPTSIVRTGLRGALRRWVLRQHTAFCANSPASRKHLERLGVSPEKIALVPNGHDVGRFRRLLTSREAVRESIGIGSGETLAIFVGRLIPTKRVCDLLDAIALLRQRSRNVRLALAGEGPRRDSLKAQCASLGLDDAVHFLGRRMDIPELLGASDLFVFPSETEGLPNAVIEAALAGLPIVACDIEGVRDIVRDERGAYLVPCRRPDALADAIDAVLRGPLDARRRAQWSRQNAENKYAIDKVMQHLYSVYEEVIHAESSARH